MAHFKMYRAPDWPKPMRDAATAVETAHDVLVDAKCVDQIDHGLSMMQAARAWFGREMLALDRARRPEFYR